MDTTSADIEDKLLSKCTDAFYQLKALSTDSHKLQVIWFLRFFVKCSTIGILLLLGIYLYENGIFDNNEFSGLHLAVLFLSIGNSIRQLMRNRRREICFKGVSDAFETTTKELSKLCHETNPSFSIVLTLLLEEINNETNIEIKSNEFISLLIFDAIIWFTNITSLLISAFYPSQFYYIILLFFIITLVTVAMENLLVDVKGKSHKTIKNINKTIKNITEEIRKIKSTLNTHEDGLDNTNDFSRKTKSETNDDSIIHPVLNEVENDQLNNESISSQTQDIDSVEDEERIDASEQIYDSSFMGNTNAESEHLSSTQNSESMTTDVQNSNVLPNQQQEERSEVDQDSEISENKTRDLPEGEENDLSKESSRISSEEITNETGSVAQEPEFIEKDDDSNAVEKFPYQNGRDSVLNESILLENQNTDPVENEDPNAPGEFHQQYVKNDGPVQIKNQDVDLAEDDTQGQNLNSTLTESENAESEPLSINKEVGFVEFFDEAKKAEVETGCGSNKDETSSILIETLNGESAAHTVTYQSKTSKDDDDKLLVPKKDENVSATCFDVDVSGSPEDGKQVGNQHSDFVATDENGEHVRLIVKKCMPSPPKNNSKHDSSDMRLSPHTELQITEKVPSNTEHAGNRKIALTYGKFHFSMDLLQPESEIDLVFNTSGKSMKKSHRKMSPHEVNKPCKKDQ